MPFPTWNTPESRLALCHAEIYGCVDLSVTAISSDVPVKTRMYRTRMAKLRKSPHHRRGFFKAVQILRTALEHCQELVFVADGVGAIQYANHACEILTGYSALELAEINLEKLAAEVPKGQSWQFMRDRALELGVFRGTTGIRCKSGNIAEVDLAITVVRDPDTQAATLACTGLAVAIQREIRPAKDTAPQTEVLGALASGITHDFNNLLMVIGAHAEMAAMAAGNQEPVMRNLREIGATVRRASDLTRRLLTFGGRQAKGAQLISINWIIEDIAAMLARIMEENIEIRVSLGKNVGMVRADPGQIERVLLNLAVNARDAMPKGGKFTIETQPCEVDSNFVRQHRGLAAGEYVLLTISDSGCGIQPSELGRIFELYYTTKGTGRGTGLGLAIVQSIVQQNGGFISAQSNLNVGTTFQIYLPVAARAEKKPAASWRKETSAPRGHEAMLIVEDQDSLRKATTEFLSSLGYDVSSAANGEEALRILDNCPDVSVVIADVVLPRLSGVELARALDLGHPEVKVILISGHRENVVMRMAIDQVKAEFLQKPFSMETLAVKVREVLNSSIPALAKTASAGR